jgi:membrane protein YdbS with pleckstrin-like domain
MTNFCPRCGKPTGPDDLFCKNCGAPLTAGGAPAASGPGAVTEPVPSPMASGASIGLQPIPTPPDLPFHLQDGEVLYRQIQPGRKLFWRFTFGGIVAAIFFLILAAIVSVLIGTVAPGSTSIAFPLFLISVGILILVISVVSGWLAYTKFRFWITNQRTVGRRGVVSYSVDSIPLETISDVIVSRSIADRLLGLSSLYIQPFGGAGFYPPQSAGAGSQFQSSNTFPGLDAAEAVVVQQQILHLRTVRRATTPRVL